MLYFCITWTFKFSKSYFWSKYCMFNCSVICSMQTLQVYLIHSPKTHEFLFSFYEVVFTRIYILHILYILLNGIKYLYISIITPLEWSIIFSISFSYFHFTATRVGGEQSPGCHRDLATFDSVQSDHRILCRPGQYGDVPALDGSRQQTHHGKPLNLWDNNHNYDRGVE